MTPLRQTIELMSSHMQAVLIGNNRKGKTIVVAVITRKLSEIL